MPRIFIAVLLLGCPRRSSDNCQDSAGAQTHPSARHDYSAAWDPVGRREILFGGGVGDSFFNDVWVLQTSPTVEWVAIETGDIAPKPRMTAAAIWDETNARMVLYGGFDSANHTLSDVWALTFTSANTASWTQLDPDGTPPAARWAHSAVWDDSQKRMIVFGGHVIESETYLGDVWSLSFATATPVWTELTTTGSAPSPRRFHSAVWDPSATRMLSYGGVSALDHGTYLGELWALSLATPTPTWSQLPSTTSVRDAPAAAWDPSHNRLIVYGGFFYTGIAGSHTIADVSWFDGQTWTSTPPSGGDALPRSDLTGVWDDQNGRMIVFGGANGDDTFDDTRALSFTGSANTPAWAGLIQGACVH